MRGKRVARAAMLVRDPDGKIEPVSTARIITECVLLALYEQNKYKRKEEDDRFSPESLSLSFVDGGEKNESAIKTSLERGVIVAEAAKFTRDLSDEPGSTLTPREVDRLT